MGDPILKILIFHAGALGDLVNTLPSLEALRAAFPEATLTAVGNANWLLLFQAAGVVENVVSLERPGMHTLFGETMPPDGIREFVAEHDLVVSWIRSPVFTAQLQKLAPRVVAFAEEFPPPPGAGHITKYYGRVLAELGITKVPEYPRLTLPAELLQNGPHFPGLVIHPGSGSPQKNWAAENFAEAARAIAAKAGIKIAILAGPADQAVAEACAAYLGLDLASRYSDLAPLELAALLASAVLVLGNDSGISHLAGALGAPVVAVFGPTDPAIWGVRQSRAINPVSPSVREVVEAAFGVR